MSIARTTKAAGVRRCPAEPVLQMRKDVRVAATRAGQPAMPLAKFSGFLSVEGSACPDAGQGTGCGVCFVSNSAGASNFFTGFLVCAHILVHAPLAPGVPCEKCERGKLVWREGPGLIWLRMIRQNEASAPESLWGTGKESFAAALKLSHGVGSSGELREAENGQTLNTSFRTQKVELHG
jgi:hypothetical protein